MEVYHNETIAKNCLTVCNIDFIVLTEVHPYYSNFENYEEYLSTDYYRKFVSDNNNCRGVITYNKKSLEAKTIKLTNQCALKLILYR